jgi:hypothetical protein
MALFSGHISRLLSKGINSRPGQQGKQGNESVDGFGGPFGRPNR